MEPGKTGDERTSEALVELGIAIRPFGKFPLHWDPNWLHWDGGKLGGLPVWLDPVSAPNLKCSKCKNVLSFLLQLYAPVSKVPSAFHRSVYVFICRNGSCLNDGAGMVALRCQLPRKNLFYDFECPDVENDDIDSLDGEREPPYRTDVQYCCICGQVSGSHCGRCRAAYYCCRDHQLAHWKSGHKEACKSRTCGPFLGSVSTHRDALLTEYDVEVVPEPSEAQFKTEEDAKLEKMMENVTVEEPQEATEDPAEMDGLNDAELTQEQLNKALGVRGERTLQDKQLARFMDQLSRSPKQCVRYSLWDNSAILWPDVPSMEAGPVASDCPRCGVPRLFEFQITPQALSLCGIGSGLEHPRTVTSCSWGSLIVYTCSKSCQGEKEGEYVQEYIQHIGVEELETVVVEEEEG